MPTTDVVSAVAVGNDMRSNRHRLRASRPRRFPFGRRTLAASAVCTLVLLICYIVANYSRRSWPLSLSLSSGHRRPGLSRVDEQSTTSNSPQKSAVVRTQAVDPGGDVVAKKTEIAALGNANPLDANADFGQKLLQVLSTPSIVCNRFLSAPGGGGGGGRGKSTRNLNFPSPEALRWPVCLDHLSEPCLIYSARIGGSNEDFEEAVRDHLGCEVVLFDPSLDADDVRRIETGKGIRALSRALGSVDATIVTGVKRSMSTNGLATDDDGLWSYVKVAETVRELGHWRRPVDVLRLDLHGGEWDVLQSFETAGLLKNVRQIVTSMHIWHGESVFSLIDRFMKTEKLVASGFRIFYSEPMVDTGLESERQKCCHLVGWVQTEPPLPPSRAP